MIEYLFFSGIFQSQNWKKLWCYRLEFSCVYYVFQTSYTAVSLWSQYPRLQVPHWKSKAVERPVHCEFCIIFLMIIPFLTVHQIMICVPLKGLLRQLVLLPGSDATSRVCPSSRPSLTELSIPSILSHLPVKILSNDVLLSPYGKCSIFGLSSNYWWLITPRIKYCAYNFYF